jgi:hypothetical protein
MKPRPRRRGSPVELVIGGCFSLFDFYIGPYSAGIRPFDLIGASVLGLSRLGDTDEPARWSSWRRVGVMLVLSVLVWALTLSLLQDPSKSWKPVLGLVLGLTVFILTCIRPARPSAMERLTRVLIIVHATALVTQFIWFRTTGAILNFHAIVGGAPRLVGAFFRPAGLFLEPSLFSVQMTMLVLLRFRAMGRLDRMCFLGLASILLSLSLLGVAAVAYILIRARPLIGAAVTGVVVAAGAAAVTVMPRDSIIYSLILSRVTSLGTDNSAQERFGGLLASADGFGVVAWLFGGGIGYDYIALGSSGVGFLISAVGVVGLALFMLGLALSAQRRDWVTAPLDVMFLLLGAPFWTFFVWWWWMASLLSVRRLVPTRTVATLPVPHGPCPVPPFPLHVQPD